MNRLPAAKAQALVEDLMSGHSIRAMAATAGCGVSTAEGYRRVLAQHGAAMTCGCGRPGGHRGWCRVLLLSSDGRRQFLAGWRRDLKRVLNGVAEDVASALPAPAVMNGCAQRAPKLPNVGLACPQLAPRRMSF